ncbi:metallophosphoesterase [Homoserinibacter sp. YIM 151385]|uniref:metallophosphoesterase n=1 Tax=Homoserinibacter sp. YIM 151385 TaxID=2985506 RepID=UPI0022F0794A|nr:metallophosphoesterase [Homoserinibacter sp. YIM 151385]WBU38618.1 metallophosphoesterase [Homoserinibacter sp. YIM 151385]
MTSPARARRSTARAAASLLLALPIAAGVLLPPEPAAAAPEGSFTIAIIPDTQGYTASAALAPTFTAQTEWIAAQREELGIAFAIHLGDLVESWPVAAQWERASASMAVLDRAGIPSSVLPGNHDLDFSTGGSPHYDRLFPPSRYAEASWNSPAVSYGGYLGDGRLGREPVDRGNKDSYSLLSAEGLDLLILNLEFESPEYTIGWAQRVIDAHPDRQVILATHGFIHTGGARSNTVVRPDTTVLTANQLWQRLVYPNCRVFMVVNGHWHDGENGEARRSDPNACGRPVHQILTDYQSRANGGDGWLRTYTFTPAEDRIDAATYSPTLGRYEEDASSRFSLSADLSGRTPEVLLAGGATWRWRNDAGAWPAGWTGAGFADGGWGSARAPLGFGSGVATSIDVPPPSSNRPRTMLFRQSFDVADAAGLSGATITTRADDGVAVWVNGTEVGRAGLPAGTLSTSTYASAAPSTSAATAAPRTFAIPAGLLRDGANVVAASTHLNYRATPDASFDLSITAQRAGAPTAPAAPVLSAAASGPDAVTLSWTSAGPGVTGFELRRDGALVATPPASARSFADAGLSPSTRYEYELVARAGALASAPGRASATTPAAPVEQPATLVASGSSWRWLRTPAAWPAGWTGAGFADGAWAQGRAPLGFGSSSIATSTDVPPPSSDRPRSTVMRHRFTVDDPSRWRELVLRTRADDGLVVFLNGVELGRAGMPTGALSAQSYATAAPRTSTAVAAGTSFAVPASALRAGENVLAVSVHLNYRATPDSSFDLQLAGLRRG